MPADTPTRPPAPTGVRTAARADLSAIGAVLERSWRGGCAALLPPAVVPLLSAGTLADAWEGAVTAPPSPRHAVLVAVADGLVVGLLALAPAADPDAGPGDGEIVELAVDPAHRRHGHGSRLLAAAADTLRAADGTALRAWTAERDEIRRGFLESAGLRPDGARRVLAAGDGTELPQVRLGAVVAEPGP